MKAIVTKYHGPTDHRGARISASDEDGNKIYLPYPHELSGEAVHRWAAQELCKMMEWRGTLVSGELKEGYVFVFMPNGWAQCVRASNQLADLVCSMYHPKDDKARKTWPTATWAEIIASELGIEVPHEG